MNKYNYTEALIESYLKEDAILNNQTKLSAEQMEEKANAATEELLKALPQREQYKALNNTYNILTNKNIEDVAVIKVMDADQNKYGITLKDARSYYPTKEEQLDDVNRSCDRIFDLIKNQIEKDIEIYYKKIFDELLTKYNISSTTHVDELRFIDLDTKQIYYLERNKDGATLCIEKNRVLYQISDPSQTPDFDKLKLVTIVDTTERYSGNCYSCTDYNVYYDPTFSEDILHSCGIFLEETEGGNGETRCRFMDPEKIPADIRKAGFTKSESHRYEIDSSD